MTIEVVNDPGATPDDRVGALRRWVDAGNDFPPLTLESNNHIHTIYSFSPYTPAMACLRGREAGLQVVGSVDHDSVAAAAEMRDAGSILGMGVVTGFECRVMLHSAEEVEQGRAPFADRKVNNPDSEGVAYMTVQAIPARSRQAAEDFLRPIRAARLERTRRMTEGANKILAALGAPTMDFESDVVGISQFASGGTITERHLLYAMSEALIACFGRGDALVEGLQKMGVGIPGPLRAVLADPGNLFLPHDLLGLLKAEYLERFYIQPERMVHGGELPDARTVVEFALRIGAIPCYAYLGDVSASPTGDKRAEAFEDSYLDELVAYLRNLGFPAITFMPPRNTAAQLGRISALADAHDMIQVSGVDINQPRQVFSCPELAEPRFAHLGDSTWALVAHEVLSDADPRRGLLHPENPMADLPLSERISAYGELGRQLVSDKGATP
ncbi:PHP domain-containing protein [Tessaracoccus antarcticus]|uniref:PHP domain-containing protein n=1 Tax=Tessaracoccus antarcticus TaxID=2479848 RepID=UPI001F2714B4|nr:PHP domain-containing protein [Tessaracoccus antarcticus]